MKLRSYSRNTREAVTLLGQEIRLGRKRRKWTESELAERAGVSRATIQKIERGDLGVGIGLVFEAATLVGLALFEDDRAALPAHIARNDALLTLLPQSVRRRDQPVDDDF